LPSIYLAYRIVQKSIFESNAQKFVREQFQFKNTQVVNKNYKYNPNSNEIELLLIGYELTKQQIDTIGKRLKNYGLYRTTLNIKQGLNAKQEIDLSQIKASILEDVFKKDSSIQASAPRGQEINAPYPDIAKEIKALYPNLNYYAISDMIIHRADTLPRDTVTMVVANFSRPASSAERSRLNAWLKMRLEVDTVKLVVD